MDLLAPVNIDGLPGHIIRLRAQKGYNVGHILRRFATIHRDIFGSHLIRDFFKCFMP